MQRQRRLRKILQRIGREEVLLLLAVLVPAALLGGFILLASEVMEGETRSFDEAILLALRNPSDRSDPIGPAWLEGAMRDLTALGGTTVLTLVAVGAVIYLMLADRRANAALLAGSVVGGLILENGLKLGFARPRPDIVAHAVDVVTLSFPSGHAMLSAITYLTLGAMLAEAQTARRIRLYILAMAVLLTLLVGASRVYLGVHYPTDVLAGWALGAAWAISCLAVARFLHRHGVAARTKTIRGNSDSGD